jgi:hypothetical protein
MRRRLKVDDIQMKTAIETNEFGKDIIGSASNVAVIMTQDWCPQWHSMNRYIENLSKDNFEADIYEILYNKESYFHDFMAFKELIFKNHSVPYIRFYRNGVFTNESNYISKKSFLKHLGY